MDISELGGKQSQVECEVGRWVLGSHRTAQYLGMRRGEVVNARERVGLQFLGGSRAVMCLFHC